MYHGQCETREMLIGANLALLEDRAIEHLSFGRDNYVAATLGTRSGGVCAPVLSYHVTEDGKVELGAGSDLHETVGRCRIKEVVVLSVRCGKYLKRFKFTPGVKRRAPYLP